MLSATRTAWPGNQAESAPPARPGAPVHRLRLARRSSIVICRAGERPVNHSTVKPADRLLDPERAGDRIDRLYRAAWGLCGNREDAEDLVQETYARVFARPRLLTKDSDLGYLLRALRNTFLIQLATKRHQVSGVAVCPDADPVDRRGYRQPEREVEATELYRAIGGLPEDFRLALVAVDVSGLSYEEAAHALGVPAGTIRSRVFRARERLADSLWPETANAPEKTRGGAGREPLNALTDGMAGSTHRLGPARRGAPRLDVPVRGREPLRAGAGPRPTVV